MDKFYDFLNTRRKAYNNLEDVKFTIPSKSEAVEFRGGSTDIGNLFESYLRKFNNR